MAVATTERRLTGRVVLSLLLGAFGVVLVVNGIMIWLALESWPGLVSETPYQDGLAFNRVIEAGESQKALGWSVAIAAPAGVIEIAMTDNGGMPLTGASLTVLARRPTNEGTDVPVTVAEASPGHYVALAPLPIAGNWDIVVDARRASADFHFERRVYIEP